MRFSFELPTTNVESPEEFVTADAIVDVTATAAAAGFAAVNVTDHPAPDGRWLDHGGHHALDPMVALGVAATADPNVMLHTNVYIPAYRNPFLAAKQVQTLDVLSQGRLILGVAAGYLRPEFAALGVDFDSRGRILDETLEVLDDAMAGADVARDGSGYCARGVRLRPVRPEGRPPVWVGGNSPAAQRRAARFEGWCPFHTAGYAQVSRTATLESVDDLAGSIDHVQQLRADAGKVGPFDVCWSDGAFGSVDMSHAQRVDLVGQLAAAGVSWMVVNMAARSRAELIDRLGDFGAEVIRPISPST